MTVALNLSEEQIVAILFCAVLIALYVIGGCVLRKHPLRQQDDPETIIDAPMTGFVFLFSPVWVPILLVLFACGGFLWAVGKSITRGRK